MLVHIGLDTVQLNGEGFETFVESGQRVEVGDTLLKFDVDYIKENAKSIISPVIITNSDQAETIKVHASETMSKGNTKVVDVTMN